ncbi:MAG: hypothetical protein AB3N21_18755 [Ruegeria sp.]
MFRPIRFVLLIAIAFIVGVFYERNAHGERCAQAGGRVVSNLCEGGQR